MPDAAVQVKPQSGKILSFPIMKVDAEKREVWGYATTEALDQQGEIVDYEGSVRAFDKWTSQFDQMTNGGSLGNIREMHGPKSVGKLIAYHPDPESRGIWVGAKITKSAEGDDAWQKVQDRVLNGFSIGAPQAERVVEFHGSKKVNRVVNYSLAELSLVDNPACPESFFKEVKLATTTGGPAFEMGVLKRFDEGENKPSGVDWKPLNIVQKTVELNPETFVDASGDVWTRLNGRVTKKENPMADPKELEKAGKKIGPDHKPPGVPPGPEAKAKPDEGAPPMPSGSGMGKEQPPASNPALGGDAANDGRNAGNGEQEKQIKGEAEGPAGQGKAADAGDRKEPDGDEAAKASDVAEAKLAGSGMAYCAMCGGKMKSFGDNVAPYHKRCIDAKKAADASASGKNAAGGLVGGVTEEGVAKAVAALINPAIKTMNENFDVLTKRIAAVEKSPATGGPQRTELPEGVRPVEKVHGAPSEGSDVVKMLEKLLPSVQDPMARDAISRQIAKASITQAQRGVMG